MFSVKSRQMKKFDWVIACLLVLGAAIFFYRLGRRDEEYETLKVRSQIQESRISNVESALEKHEARWGFLNRVVDKIRGLLPWPA